MGEDLARLALLLIAGAAFVNLTRGTFRAWLRAKAIGDVPAPASRSGTPGASARPIPTTPSSPGGRGGV